MNDPGKIVESFFNDMAALYSSRSGFFNTSFYQSIIDKNIALIKEKKYAITDDIWEIDEAGNMDFLSALMDLIQKHIVEYRDEAGNLKKIFESNREVSKKYILDVLTNNGRNIVDFSIRNRLSNDFLTFYSIFAAYKYRNAVTLYVKNRFDLSSHVSGLCPVCGHWPGISYITGETGARIMQCICCGAGWTFRRMKCSFCLKSGKESLGYLNIEGVDNLSVYTCDSCRRYIKTVRVNSEELGLDDDRPLFDYLKTGFLDIAAIQNKYVQESMLTTRFTGAEDEHLREYIDMLEY